MAAPIPDEIKAKNVNPFVDGFIPAFFFGLPIAYIIASNVFAYFTQYQLPIDSIYQHIDPHGSGLFSHAYWYGIIKWTTLSFTQWDTSVMMKPLVASWSVFFFIILTFFSIGYSRSRKILKKAIEEVRHLHGSAHWGSFKEAVEAKLVAKSGVFLGGAISKLDDGTDQNKKFKDSTKLYMRHDGPEHICVIAPTRSGKGVSVVIPTMLGWMHSVICNDIKNELWSLTSGFRSKLGPVIRFAPAEIGSARFNPLGEIRIGTQFETSDAQNIATMIVDPDGKGLNDHWAKTGYGLVTACILHVLYVGTDKSPRGVLIELERTDRTLMETFEAWMNTDHWPRPPKDYERWKSGDTSGMSDDEVIECAEYTPPPKHWVTPTGEVTYTHPTIAGQARGMLDKAEAELSGVVSTAKSFLNLYSDPIVAENTMVSDFTIRDLVDGDRPVTLYMVATPDNIDRLKPLLRLVYNQVLRTLVGKMQYDVSGQGKMPYKHRLLMLMDEFTSLGNLEIFPVAMAYMAGYGVKAVIIIQDFVQLYKVYGKEESVTSNCHVQIMMAPNRPDSGEQIAKYLGKKTVHHVSESVSSSISGWITQQSGQNTSWNHSGRELMNVDELMALDENKIIIRAAGSSPFLTEKLRYYKNRNFISRIGEYRANIPEEQRTDRLYGDVGLPPVRNDRISEQKEPPSVPDFSQEPWATQLSEGYNESVDAKMAGIDDETITNEVKNALSDSDAAHDDIHDELSQESVSEPETGSSSDDSDDPLASLMDMVSETEQTEAEEVDSDSTDEEPASTESEPARVAVEPEMDIGEDDSMVVVTSKHMSKSEVYL